MKKIFLLILVTIIGLTGTVLALTGDQQEFIDEQLEKYRQTIADYPDLFEDQENVDIFYATIRELLTYKVETINGLIAQLPSSTTPPNPTTNSCAEKPSSIIQANVRLFQVGSPTQPNQSWQSTSQDAPCYYYCNSGFDLPNCTDGTEPPIYSCTTRPSTLTDTNTLFDEGTPTAVSQSWQNQNSTSPCYYSCKEGFSGADCTSTESDVDYTSTESGDYRINISKDGDDIGGTITGAGVNCDTECHSDTFALTTPSVTLTATPATNYQFDGWSGACTNTTGTCQVNLSTTETKNVVAKFSGNTPTQSASVSTSLIGVPAGPSGYSTPRGTKIQGSYSFTEEATNISCKVWYSTSVDNTTRGDEVQFTLSNNRGTSNKSDKTNDSFTIDTTTINAAATRFTIKTRCGGLINGVYQNAEDTQVVTLNAITCPTGKIPTSDGTSCVNDVKLTLNWSSTGGKIGDTTTLSYDIGSYYTSCKLNANSTEILRTNEFYDVNGGPTIRTGTKNITILNDYRNAAGKIFFEIRCEKMNIGSYNSVIVEYKLTGSSGDPTSGCPEGKILGSDGTTCVNDTKLLISLSKTSGKIGDTITMSYDIGSYFISCNLTANTTEIFSSSQFYNKASGPAARNGTKSITIQNNYTMSSDPKKIVFYVDCQKMDNGSKKGIGTTFDIETSICPKGEALQFYSPDESNSCDFKWDQANINESLVVTLASSGGTLSGDCGTNGEWNYIFNCPNTVNSVPCDGGSRTISSSDGTRSCVFTWGQGVDGGTIPNVSATNGGLLSGTCRSTGWDFSFSCPNETAKSCAGGSHRVDGCLFTWPLTTAGTSFSSGAADGDGSISADCNTDGNWENLKVDCKTK